MGWTGNTLLDGSWNLTNIDFYLCASCINLSRFFLLLFHMTHPERGLRTLVDRGKIPIPGGLDFGWYGTL
jgi:hypothetical protein